MVRRDYKRIISNLLEIAEVDKGNSGWQLFQIRCILKELKNELDLQEEKVHTSAVAAREKTSTKGENKNGDT